MATFGSDIKFNILKSDLSRHYGGEKYRMLKFCLLDFIPEGYIKPDYIANDLFNLLQDKGVISATNVCILLEVAKLSHIKEAVDLVSQYMKDNNLIYTNAQQLSPYRRRLFKALVEVGKGSLFRITSYYNLTHLMLPNIWDVACYLESELLLEDKPEKIESFASILTRHSRNILLDGFTDSDSRSALSELKDIQLNGKLIKDLATIFSTKSQQNFLENWEAIIDEKRRGVDVVVKTHSSLAVEHRYQPHALEIFFNNLAKDKAVFEAVTTKLNYVDVHNSGSGDGGWEEIPYFITAGGKRAKEAYIEAFKGGKVKMNLGMLKVIGQEGVGKTCLINALLGKKFEVAHKVTDGIAMITTVSTTWEEDTEDSGNPTKQYTKCFTDKLNEKESSTINDKTNEATLRGMKTKTVLTADHDDTSMQKNKEVNKKMTADGGETIPFDAKEQLDEEVIQDIEKNKGKTYTDTFNIWDHGGQLIYHGIHRLFMTLEALYVVVFDLSKPLNARATVIDSNGKKHKHHWTNLQFILSYILTVYSHSRILRENTGKEVDQPTILIVGTHKGKLGKTEEEQNAEAKKIFKQIKKSIKKKPYAKHIYDYFAIENSKKTTDESFYNLKQVIDQLMTDLKKEVPLKLLRFRCGLHDLRKEKLLCPLKELKTLTSKNGIDESEKAFLLNFLYDLGEVIYMPDNKLLRNQVVLNPDSLVEIVTAFVTVVSPDFPPAKFSDAFDKLDQGILEEDLLRKLWEEREVDVGKDFDYLVELMIRLGFICERKTTSSQDMESTSTESILKRSFFVPLRLAFKTSTEVKPSVPDDSQSISIYYDFKGYLPDVLFPYIIIDFLNKFQIEGFEPELSCDHAELYLDQYHHVTLSLVKFVTKEDERKFLLKVTIKRTNTFEGPSDEEPSSEACKRVLSVVEMSVEHSKDGGRRGIQFKRCIPCLCSDTSEKKHFQIVGDFQHKTLPCNKHGMCSMDVTRYQRLFGDDVRTSRPNADLSKDDFRQLITDFAKWFDQRELFNRLQVLFIEKLGDIEAVKRVSSTIDLLALLTGNGLLSETDLSVLYDTIKVTEQFGFESVIKEKLPAFNNIKKLKVASFSLHTKKVFNLGKNLSDPEIKTLDGRYNFPVLKKYADSWSLILDFQSRGLLTEDKIESVRSVLS